ncbi:MAG: DUF262 domain-containing protein [Nakamurella multipartita]
MTNTVLSQPSAATFRLSALVRNVLDGAVRVPHFQRSFRWDARDVGLLFDSILRGYPVGSVLLWQRAAPADPSLTLGALTLNVPVKSDALWVVDGQQRITTLVNAVNQHAWDVDPRFRLVYDLSSDRVVHAKEGTGEHLVPLPVMFDLRILLPWVQQRPELTDQISALNEVAIRLQNFELPASVVKDASQEVMQDIFDRMNSSGKRLRRAEIFSAIYAADESRVGEALSVAAIGDHIAGDTTFGRIDDDTILQVILSRRGSDPTRDIRREFDDDTGSRSDFPQEDRDGAHRAGAEALRRAVAFLQDNAGVPHISFLPYRFLLVVLSRFFAHFPTPHPRNLELISRWFWRAALLGPTPFKGSTTGAVRALNGRIVPGQESTSAQGLLAAIEHVGPLPGPNFARFRTNDSSTKVILCALWARGPRSLDTRMRLTTTDIANVLESQATARDLAVEVIPGRQLDPQYRSWAANRLISFDPPEVVIAGLEPDPLFESGRDDAVPLRVVRDSHLVSDEAAAQLATGRAEVFLMTRDQDLRTAVGAFLRRRSGVEFEPTPPLSEFDLDDDEAWA